MRPMNAPLDDLHARFRAGCGADAAPRVVRAPYRLSPIGAHTDHQLGLATGVTIDAGVHLLFRPRPDGALRLASREEPARLDARVSEPGAFRGDWTDLVRALVPRLGADAPLTVGIEGVLGGDWPPGGIASSAAVTVACLLALAEVNGRPWRGLAAARLARDAEREARGVGIGLLDPAVILSGRPECLVVLDPLEEKVQVHRFPRRMEALRFLLLDSGVRRELSEVPYDERVAECRTAALSLGAPQENPVLRRVSPETFRRLRRDLDPVSLRRAEHFFSEHKRVRLALRALVEADARALGRLMSASGESLARDFDAGSPETDALARRAREIPGVLGANVAGGGFGGHVQALCRAAEAEAALERLLREEEGRPGARAGRVVATGAGAHVAS